VSVLRIYHEKPELLARVKGVVLEAPFADLPATVKFRYGILSPIVMKGLEILTNYKFGGYPSPLEHAEKYKWPTHIPVMIIRSKADEIVPPEGTKQLIDALRDNRNNSGISLMEVLLARSCHSSMAIDDDSDVQLYKQSMAEFLRLALFRDYPDLFSH